MSFNDDEPIVATQDVSGKEKPAAFIAGKTKATAINNPDAPLEENKFKVLLELTGSGSGDDRSGVDLVTILDISGSMQDDNKIEKMKTAMQFVIRKLSPIDRLSVITFSENSKRLCPLRQITETSQKEIEGLVNSLTANGATNITAGLQTGLKVIGDRRVKSGRVVGIILMSDGQQNRGSDAAQVVVKDVPVYTFGFGANHDPKVLKAIADNSKGGTFSDVQNQNNLSIAFSQCLAGILTVVVQDLKLTVAQVDQNSTIENVSSGNYPQSTNKDEGSVSISFGDLYNKEVRKVIVNLLLPAVSKRIGTDILEINYSYSTGGKLFDANPITINVTRKGSELADRNDKLEVTLEENRIRTAEMMRQARVMADEKNLEDAKDMLVEAENLLEDVVLDENDTTNTLLDMLRTELQMFLRLMKSQDTYESKGRSFALSSETSHARQRFACRGDVDKLRLFATPRMDSYLDQARAFEEDPSKPLPSVEEDVKLEIAADPIGPIVGPISYYIQSAIQALQAIDKLINAGR